MECSIEESFKWFHQGMKYAEFRRNRAEIATAIMFTDTEKCVARIYNTVYIYARINEFGRMVAILRSGDHNLNSQNLDRSRSYAQAFP